MVGLQRPSLGDDLAHRPPGLWGPSTHHHPRPSHEPARPHASFAATEQMRFGPQHGFDSCFIESQPSGITSAQGPGPTISEAWRGAGPAGSEGGMQRKGSRGPTSLLPGLGSHRSAARGCTAALWVHSTVLGRPFMEEAGRFWTLLQQCWPRCWPRLVPEAQGSAVTPSDVCWSHGAHPHGGSQDGV